jgi:hypothetical protein
MVKVQTPAFPLPPWDDPLKNAHGIAGPPTSFLRHHRADRRHIGNHHGTHRRKTAVEFWTQHPLRGQVMLSSLTDHVRAIECDHRGNVLSRNPELLQRTMGNEYLIETVVAGGGGNRPA